ncbi:MAG TPA: cysteine synthase family protein [Chloroflexota bacterium]|nr:cysteine synthase family protein [Chloroflexota bacterium]
MRYNSIIDAIGHTPLVEMKNLSPSPSVRLFAKLEGHNPTGSIKDRIARSMIESAERSGALRPGMTILESTSGNTGISLAMIGRLKGYRVRAVMPDNLTPERAELLELFGAEIVYSPGAEGSNGAIRVAEELAAAGDCYHPYQYGNPANPQAHYDTTAVEILEDLPEVDVFVAGLGTGGTLMGVGRRLKETNPRVQIVAAEPLPGEAVQGLRSLEEGFTPPILDTRLLDRKMLVSNRDSVIGVRLLAEREGIFAGVSSGANLHVALRVARQMERGNIVVLLCDGGWKYVSAKLWTRDLPELTAAMEESLWW